MYKMAFFNVRDYSKIMNNRIYFSDDYQKKLPSAT